jgi:hypothetical protein
MEKTLFLLTVVLFFFIFSCNLIILSNDEFYKRTTALKDVDVYCAGWYTDGGIEKACYWKNEKIVPLAEGISGYVSYASSIDIYGGDIYVGGHYEPPSFIPCYWKNGIRYDLPHEGDAEVTSISAKKGSIFCTGYDRVGGIDTACLWINNIKYTIGSDNLGLSIFTDDDLNIYLVGKDNANTKGFFWNTGMDSVIDFASPAMSVFVYGADVFIGLQNGNIFKNNKFLFTTPGSSPLSSIFVYKDDIYITRNGEYYKNNETFSLPSVTTVSKLYVFKDAVYIAGNNAGGNASYWKNQQQYLLENAGDFTNSRADDIKVVKRR